MASWNDHAKSENDEAIQNPACAQKTTTNMNVPRKQSCCFFKIHLLAILASKQSKTEA